jgi:hypothetical protein
MSLTSLEGNKRVSIQRVFEKFLVMYQILLDPPKSPLKRGTLIDFPPFLRGARGDH